MLSISNSFEHANRDQVEFGCTEKGLECPKAGGETRGSWYFHASLFEHGQSLVPGVDMEMYIEISKGIGEGRGERILDRIGCASTFIYKFGKQSSQGPSAQLLFEHDR
jgi:hypothetical protein